MENQPLTITHIKFFYAFGITLVLGTIAIMGFLYGIKTDVEILKVTEANNIKNIDSKLATLVDQHNAFSQNIPEIKEIKDKQIYQESEIISINAILGRNTQLKNADESGTLK